MNAELSDEALEVGEVIRESVAAAGGVGILRAAVNDPSARAASGELLDRVGVWDLNPLGDRIELEVAAAVCHAAGHDALPYPVAERLAHRVGVDATTFVAQEPPRLVMHADLDLAWSALDLHGRTYRVTRVVPGLIGTQLAPFASIVEVEADGDADPRATALLVTLQSWWLLGLLDHVTADTVRYTREREQFGRALIQFQAVGFQLADMTVATQSLEELAKYTLWSVGKIEGSDTALADALALRTATLDAADVVFRSAHQLHGAMGFTDEVDISWLSRASHSVRRLPEGEHRTRSILTELIEKHGWEEYGRVRAAAITVDG